MKTGYFVIQNPKDSSYLLPTGGWTLTPAREQAAIFKVEELPEVMLNHEYASAVPFEDFCKENGFLLSDGKSLA
jgi:hypothetical protein